MSRNSEDNFKKTSAPANPDDEPESRTYADAVKNKPRKVPETIVIGNAYSEPEGDSKLLLSNVFSVCHVAKFCLLYVNIGLVNKTVDECEQVVTDVKMVRALIDSGASVSVLPAHCVPESELKGAPPKKYFSVTGEELKIKGVVTKNFYFESKRFQWDFIVADVQTAILGVDFLANYDVVVSYKTLSLIHI